MTRRSTDASPDAVRRELMRILDQFETELSAGSLRSRVQALIPAGRTLRLLGVVLVPGSAGRSARARLLHYLRKYPMMPLQREELTMVAGIQEWARRVRELRVESGWNIVTGATAKEMAREGDFELPGIEFDGLAKDDYILLDETPDTAAAARWQLSNEIRNGKGSIRAKILKYLRSHIGEEIPGEELRYVANDKTEWARRVRELRTEEGWPIVTHSSGRPDLKPGVYVLEDDRQSPGPDRNIPDSVRGAVLRRDSYACQECGWTHELWNRSDPRHLELHHKIHHADGGETTEQNLVTLCTVCHDQVHAVTDDGGGS